MKVAETLLAALVVSLATFVVVQTTADQRRGDAEAAGIIAAGSAADAPDVARYASGAADSLSTGALRSGRSEGRLLTTERYVPDVPRDAPWPAADMRRRLAQGETGTYIGALLAARDSVITRWPDRSPHAAARVGGRRRRPGRAGTRSSPPWCATRSTSGRPPASRCASPTCAIPPAPTCACASCPSSTRESAAARSGAATAPGGSWTVTWSSRSAIRAAAPCPRCSCARSRCTRSDTCSASTTWTTPAHIMAPRVRVRGLERRRRRDRAAPVLGARGARARLSRPPVAPCDRRPTIGHRPTIAT